jgi:tetratricopeptide (TPR) repeat protein
MRDGVASAHDESLRLARRGLLLCRGGNWEEGSNLLGKAFDTASAVVLPGTVYSFLGYGLARQHGRYRQGLSLCEHALRVEPGEPENYVNLARTLLLMNRRRKALGILNRGLALAPEDPALLDVRLALGVRRSPVVPFLDRDHLVNRLLGRVRHGLRQGDGE